MSFSKGAEDYYRKFVELQQKLRRSEEERLRLEMKFNEMMQFTREEEEAHHRKLEKQYQHFLEEDQKRQERNARIVTVLERIENRAALLAAKTERFQMFRKQYTSYLKQMSGDVHYQPTIIDKNTYKKPTNLQSNRSFSPASKSGDELNLRDYQIRLPKSKINGELRDHPIIKKALNGNQRSLNDDLESLKSYLNNRSPIHEQKPTTFEYNQSESDEDQIEIDRRIPSQKTDDSMEKIIRWKPKFQLPRRSRFQFRRSRWNFPERFPSRSYNFSKKESPSASPSFKRRQFEPSRFREDARRDYGDYKTTHKVPSSIGNNFDFNTPSTSYYQPEKSVYSTSPARSYVNDDLDYQLSNYPNLDVGNRVNIEYTVYPKISEISNRTNQRSYSPSTSHARENYRSYSPIRNKVSWYDHYLGRCPVAEMRNEMYPRYNPDNYDVSKTKQDSILLNSEIRSTKYPEYPKKATYESKKVEFVDEKNYATVVPEEVTKVTEVTENIPEDLCKDEPDETEDQVLSEVFPEDVLDTPKQNPVIEEISPDPSTNLEKYEEETPTNFEKFDDDYYEEKHDSLEETQKENIAMVDDISKENEQNESVIEENTKNDDIEEVIKQEESIEEKEEIVEKRDIENDDAINQNEKKEEEILNEKLHVEEPSEPTDNESVIENEVKDTVKEIVPEADDKIDTEKEKEPEFVVEKSEDSKEIETPENINREAIVENPEVNSEIKDKEYASAQIENQQYTTDYQNAEYQDNAQYDENGQPIQYSEYDQSGAQYDENGQPIGYGDGQYYQQYDENGQLIPQYDENGQLIQQYDENGQPIVQYDENGQPIVQYDENGQPIYEYDQYYQNQQYESQEQQYQETGDSQYQSQQEYEESQQYQEGNQEYEEKVKSEENEKAGEGESLENNEEGEKKSKVMEMLDSESESTKNQEAKVSNDSDFDISNK